MSDRDTDQRFASRLPAMASLAGRCLGWRPNDFWAATPQELAMMMGWLTAENQHDHASASMIDKLLKEFPDG